MDRTAMLQTIKGWPLEQRIDFVEQVWDHIVDQGWQPVLTDEMKAELDRRLAAHAADPGNVLTWGEVVAQVRRPR